MILNVMYVVKKVHPHTPHPNPGRFELREVRVRIYYIHGSVRKTEREERREGTNMLRPKKRLDLRKEAIYIYETIDRTMKYRGWGKGGEKMMERERGDRVLVVALFGYEMREREEKEKEREKEA